MGSYTQTLTVAALAGLMLMTGCAADSADQVELSAKRQAEVDAINGLKAINGLSTKNGLKAINGLSTRNGLKTINGLDTVNGLRTFNGLKTINGLDVDCTGKTEGVDCSGEPDGLLSAGTGMMATDDGIMTAKYLVRCALPAGQSITIKDYTGALINLPGEIGFAPEWQDGQCDGPCQEKISACLMSLTNSAGNHISVDLSAPFTVGTGHDSAYKYQEAAFFGNLFLNPPQSAFAVGKDYAGFNFGGVISVGAVANRLCAAIVALLGPNACPYQPAGDMNFEISDPFGISSNKCSVSNGAATKCKDKSGKTWNYPITTYRTDKGAT
ncbi:MAG: hypothetical protein JWN04_4875 [Myxococcaceae bacterium]|nr:hypothetical protein [Myxococcaceae bacterium]